MRQAGLTVALAEVQVYPKYTQLEGAGVLKGVVDSFEYPAEIKPGPFSSALQWLTTVFSVMKRWAVVRQKRFAARAQVKATTYQGLTLFVGGLHFVMTCAGKVAVMRVILEGAVDALSYLLLQGKSKPDSALAFVTCTP
jgi:hypothetical protein